MTYRPLNTKVSDLGNYQAVNDFMRDMDGREARSESRLLALETQLNGLALTAQVVKPATDAQEITTIPHGLTYTPQLIYGIEDATNLPGEWSSGAWLNFNNSTGVLNGQVYMSADATNVYLVANTPSGTALYGSAITFNAWYRYVGGA